MIIGSILEKTKLPFLVLAAVLFCGGIQGCVPDAPADNGVAPLPQDGRIPIEIMVNGNFVTVHPTQAAVENIAAMWCNADRTYSTDKVLCGGATTYQHVEQAILASSEAQAIAIAQSSSDLCGEALCFERNEVCAGYMMEELGKSPIPRTLDPASAYPRSGLQYDAHMLQLTAAEAASVGVAIDLVAPTTIPQIRLQPLAAPGRAAALRGALNRHRRSTRIAEVMRTADGVPPNPDGTVTTTCDVVFAQRDQGGTGPALLPDRDGRTLTWSDVWMETFADGATQQLSLVRDVTTAMKESAESQVRGRDTDVVEVETQWNGQVDSATATARVLGFGSATLATATSQNVIHPNDFGSHSVQPFFQGGAAQTPVSAPTCPPKNNNDGATRAVAWAQQMKIAPACVKTETFDQIFVDAYNEDLANAGLLQSPLDANTVYARLHLHRDLDSNNVATSKDDVIYAGEYLDSQATAQGITQQCAAGSAPTGFTDVPRLYRPIAALTSAFRPPAIIATNFLGAPTTQNAMTLGGLDYSQHGAIAAVDQVKRTAAAFTVPSSPLAPHVGPVLSAAVTAINTQGAILVGAKRVEFMIGVSPDGTTLTKVKVRVHGVPVANGQLDGEAYAVVQGLDGVKCVVDGSVDGAPCTSTDYLHVMPTAVSPLDSNNFDLTGGTLEEELTSLPQPGNPATPIATPTPIYLLQAVNGGAWTTYSGAIPVEGLPHGTYLPNDPNTPTNTYTRRIYAPVGGDLQNDLQNAVLPDSDDCSKPADSCAGIPVGYFPPLDNELSGENANQPYEQSWQHYLDDAQSAADFADQLGEKLVQDGLQMDIRRENALQALRDLCGPDADQNGCSAIQGLVTATLGDLPVCLWQSGGQVCKCKGGACPDSVSCPIQLPPTTQPTQQACEAAVTGKGVAWDSVTLVTATLGLAQTTQQPDPGGVPPCKVFEDLRVPPPQQPYPDGSSAREEAIRTLANDWNRPTIATMAAGLRYTEEFADHYQLTYNDAIIFETKRPKPQADNNASFAPCAQTVSDADKSTGATFWSNAIQCYVSGPNCGGQSCSQCPPTGGVGWDGCPTSPINGDYTLLSLDTEPDALRSRWAWGFANLRRSVATLGVISGALDGMMYLALPGSAAYEVGVINSTYAGLVPWDFMGALSTPATTDQEPLWVFHAARSSKDDLKPSVRCVALGGVSGIDTDTSRLAAGRPVNFNQWLTFSLPFVNGDPNDADHFALGNYRDFVLPDFPCYPSGSSCAPTGLDPQMMYCGIPDPDGWLQQLQNNGSISASAPTTWTDSVPIKNTSGFPSVSYTSGYIGSSTPVPVHFSDAGEWNTALEQMWQQPASGPFCSPPAQGGNGAIWSALCTAPAPFVADVHTGNAQPDQAPVYFSRNQVASWLNPDHKSSAPYLFNLQHTALDTFQYAVDQRNIYDALELICHAASRPRTAVLDCKAVGPNFVPSSADEISQIMKCYANQLNFTVGRYVVGPVPQAVVDAFEKNNGVLSTTTGIGGELLDAMNHQMQAILAIRTDYAHIHDAYVSLGLAAKDLDQVDTEAKYKHKAEDDQAMAATLRAAATAFQALADAAGGLLGSVGSSGGLGSIAASFSIAAGVKEVDAIHDQEAADDAAAQQKRITVIEQMLQQLANARDASTDISTQLNELALNAGKIASIAKSADIANAQANFSDYVGDAGNDPQYVNVAMRRTYNTDLIRYRAALDRAKKLAFIARRAVELRFGVDLQRMTTPMTLVDAPATWATRVCTMEGINYSAIRSPNPDASVSSFKFDGPPGPGDDYANQFIGDYVKQLSDFVTSYPIDFPLKDGDDTAVISLKDDVFRSGTQCDVPSKNQLYFSAGLGKRNEPLPTESTHGWFVRGCGGTTDIPASTEWTGCVDVTEEGRPAGSPDVDGGSQGIASFDVSLDGLPAGAVPYRLGSVPCVSGGDGGVTCPSQTTNTAFGTVSQIVNGLQTGLYVASAYVHAAPPPDNALNYVGNAASLRVVRRSDQVVISEQTFTPTSAWVRIQLPFSAEGGLSYRVDLVPSAQQASISTNSDIAFWAAAAQVEAALPQGDGGVGGAGAWDRTDDQRVHPTTLCADVDGVNFRRRFARRCEYVCNDGIHPTCPQQDTSAVPTACFYEASFAVALDDIESGKLIPTGQIAIGNFNFRHNLLGLNMRGTSVLDCSNSGSQSCYDNAFTEYTLIHNGDVSIRNWSGATFPAHMDTAFIEHGKALAAERVITNPPSSADTDLLTPYMKGELKGRPIEGLYTLRVFDAPNLRWENVTDIQLVAKYHYWTRFSH